MLVINVSGVPMSGKSATGIALVNRLNQKGQKAAFIEVDDLISEDEKKINKKKCNGDKECEIKENESTKRQRLLDLIDSYKKSGEYSVVVFACLMTPDFHETCANLYGRDYKSISLVPSLNVLLHKRGHRIPTEEVQELIIKMYKEWGFGTPKTADFVIDNSHMTVKKSVNVIMDFLQISKDKSVSFNTAKRTILERVKRLFVKNKNQQMQ